MKIVLVKQFIISILFFIVLSCKKQEINTFHKEISYQHLLNKTDFFNDDNIDFFKIRYNSDNLEIEGYIAKPNQTKTTKLPAIIFCRGGNQSFGMLNGYQLRMIKELSLKGFVVLASQLRGNMSSEGVDEFGGNDVNDILKLIKIAKELDFIETNNIHVLGYSRGGMNTYQVSKLTDDINSIAVVGGSTNKFSGSRFRESMYLNVYKPLFGDSINDREAYIKRSPVFWHKKINEPTLILHGKDDARVNVEDAQQLIDSFVKTKKSDFQYKIFEAGNHPLSNYSHQRDSLIINWFKTNSK